MLSVFPSLLTYQMFSPLILRVVLGFVLVTLGYLKLKKERARWNLFFQTIHLKPAHLFTKAFGLLEIFGGIALILGFYTQVAALVFAVINLCELCVESKEATLLKRDMVFYLLLFVIALSLLFTGPGFYAFDLPL